MSFNGQIGNKNFQHLIMENTLQLKPGTKGNHAFVKQSQKSEDRELNQLPNNHLMELIAQIKKGDQNAMETLSVRYIQLVITVANDFKGNGLSDLELILKGNTGLIKAAENFDTSRGIDFDAYATWSIRQQLMKAIDEYEFLKPLPLNKIGLLSNRKFFNQTAKDRVDQLL